GTLNNLVLAPNANYKLSIFNPQNLKVGSAQFTTLSSGSSFKLPPVVLSKSSSPDIDGDGLGNDAEFVIGTSQNKKDTDNDGINDFAEIQQGLDPLGGQGFPTGIIASLPLLGEAKG
ncbi:MAG: thrombospondin type 3 repeat-containing protein, partial [Dolichospermum sp.]